MVWFTWYVSPAAMSSRMRSIVGSYRARSTDARHGMLSSCVGRAVAGCIGATSILSSNSANHASGRSSKTSPSLRSRTTSAGSSPGAAPYATNPAAQSPRDAAASAAAMIGPTSSARRASRTPTGSPNSNERSWPGVRSSNRARIISTPSAFSAVDRLDQLGNEGQRVADDPHVGQAEDRGVPVTVDRDDPLRRLHPHHVLRRTADADGDVHLGANRLSRLADLVAVRNPAGVDDGAARAHGGVSDRLGKLVEQPEIRRVLQTAAAGDDDLRVLELRTGRSFLVAFDALRRPQIVGDLDVDRHDVRVSADAFGDERLRANEHQPRRGTFERDVDNSAPTEDLRLRGVVARQLGRIAHQRGAEPRLQTTRDVTCVVARREQDDVGGVLARERFEREGLRPPEAIVVRFVVAGVDGCGAMLAELVRRRRGARTERHSGDVAAERAGLGEELERRW